MWGKTKTQQKHVQKLKHEQKHKQKRSRHRNKNNSRDRDRNRNRNKGRSTRSKRRSPKQNQASDILGTSAQRRQKDQPGNVGLRSSSPLLLIHSAQGIQLENTSLKVFASTLQFGNLDWDLGVGFYRPHVCHMECVHICKTKWFFYEVCLHWSSKNAPFRTWL